MLGTRRRIGFIIAFLALPSTVYAVYVVSPYIQAFQIAFTDWQGVSANRHYVGFANFRSLFADATFW